MTFDFNGPSNGGAVSHTAGTDTFTLNETGTYRAIWRLSVMEANQFALHLNGTPLAGSRYGVGTLSSNYGTTTFSANAGDTLTLVNDTSTGGSVTLSNSMGGDTDGTSASITIFKLV